jgi:hypothetical protein
MTQYSHGASFLRETPREVRLLILFLKVDREQSFSL